MTLSSPRGDSADERDTALDVARGLAVVCMMYEHFVPDEMGSGLWSRAAGFLLQLADGKSAALFCVLLGIGMSLQVQRSRDPAQLQGRLLHRGLALTALGCVFGATLWPTEILMPMGLMTLLSIPLLGRSPVAVLVVALAVLGAEPLVAHVFAGYVDGDWLEDGRNLRELQTGWVTVRYVLMDGSYPLVPWLAYPLLGMALGAIDWKRPGRARRWFAALLPAAVACQAYALWADRSEEAIPPELLSTWVPSSIPFVLLGASTSLAVLTGLFAWQESEAGLPEPLAALAPIGRTSLTHYLLHIGLVYTLLRHRWPEEDWPLQVGMLALLGYVLVAIPATRAWLSVFGRGPIEKLLAMAAGGERRSVRRAEPWPQESRGALSGHS